MTALVSFATREGQTRKVAACLEKRLAELGLPAQCHDAADNSDIPDLAAYELLVFGGSLHAGGLESELVQLINDNAARIETRPRAFFLVSLSAATRDPKLREQWLADARRKMNRQLDVDFDHCEMIAGALAYSKYSAPVKWLMRRIARQAGEDTDTSRDYEYTDWNQVERFAADLVEKVRGQNAG